MKDVYLHGALGERFGKKWRFAVSTPNEVFQAIHANTDGFLEYLNRRARENVEYAVLTKTPEQIWKESQDLRDVDKYVVTEHDMDMKLKSTELHVIPLVEGAGTEGFFLALLKKIIVAIIVAVIVGGIMKMLFKPPEKKDPIQTKSYLFGGARNVEKQGIPVPLGYGRMRIGSAVIGSEKRSFRMSNKDRAEGADTLESYSNFKYTELLCEGPIDGFVNANGGPVSSTSDGILEGIYFNETPVKNTPLHNIDAGTPNEDVGGTYNYILNEEDELPLVKLGETGEKNPFPKGTASTVDYAIALWGAAPYAGGETVAHHETCRSAIDSGAKLFTHSVINEDVRKIRMSMRTTQFFQKSDGTIQANTIRFAIRLKVDDSLINICDNISTTTATQADIDDERYDGTVDGNPKAVNIGDTISYHMGKTGRSFGLDWGSGRDNKVESIYGKDGYFTLTGIATADYEFDIEFWLPATNSFNKGIQIQVIRLSSELDPSAKTDADGVGGATQKRNIAVSSITESIEESFLYPHSAVVQVSFDSKNFSQLPARSYHLRMKRVLVPSNYDPVSRKYDGPWDGLFHGQGDQTESIHSVSDNNRLWTDNPAWIFYDILNNTRHGLGKFGVLEENIDKWQLYKIAKYCDELVETGYPNEYPDGLESGTGLEAGRRYFSTDNIEVQQPNPKTAGGYEVSPEIAAAKTEAKSKWADSAGVINVKNKTYFLIELSQMSTGGDQYAGDAGIKAFKKEFGDGESFKGKKVAFFIKTFSNGRYHDAGIEERYIVQSSATDRTVILQGPSFATHGATSPGGDTMGQCSTQISYALVEPRFTANIYVTDRLEALQILNHLASVFRGIVAYTNGKVIALQDSYKKPIQIFNNSNVDAAGFSYTGTVKNKKFSAVLIRYNDKDNNFRPSVAYMEDADAIQKFGYVESDVLGFGCTSPSQAQRLAKWILHTSQLEIESIVFRTGQEASYLFPGSVFEVSDEVRAGQYRSGRILGVHPRTKVSDGEFFDSAFLQLDKDHIGSPVVGRVEVVIAAGQVDVTDQNITLRAPFERSSDDQDAEIDSIKSPQLLRFDGVMASDNSKSGPQGQSTVAKDLMLKLPLEISLPENKIKSFRHGLQNGDRVRFVTEGAKLPEPLTRYRVGTSAYYVINKTKHTFRVSKTEGGVAEDIRSVGQDEFGNVGGYHYFCPESFEKTKEAVEKIMIGAPWSIKGVVGTAKAEILSETALGYAGIESYVPGVKGWVKSSIFGSLFLSGNGWAFSPTLGWFNISSILNRGVSDTNLWFFKEELGWIWTNDTYASRDTAPGGTPYWYIPSHDKDSYDTAKQTELGLTTTEGWVIPHFTSSGDELPYVFVYDTKSTYSEGDEYRLGRHNGVGMLFPVHQKVLDSGGSNTLGYWLKVPRFSNTVVTISPVDSSPISKPSSVEEGYNDSILDIYIHGISQVSAANSLQNKNSVKFSTYTDSVNFTLHKLDGADVIRINASTVVIDSASHGALNASTTTLRDELRGIGSAGKYWHVLKVNGYEFELVDSEGAYDLMEAGASITSTGTVNKHRRPNDSARRKLQGQFFRTAMVKEMDDNQYEVTGIEYNAAKFDSIDKKTIIKKPLLPIPPQEDMAVPPAPDGLLLTDLTKA